MELSMELGYLRRMYGTDRQRPIEQIAALGRGAGFRYADYTPEFETENWEAQARHDREVLDAAGIAVVQTHAPFNRYGKFPDDKLKDYYWNVFRGSKLLGAKYVVVHADEYRTVDHYDEKEIEDFAYDFLAPYVAYARANEMTVAIETVFEDRIRRCPQFDGKSRFTSRLHELQGLIERFNDDAVRCCWDFGHAACAYGLDGMTDALKQMGKYVVCTHVHDNYAGKDLHVAPFLGNIDWEAQMGALRTIGYTGTLSMEFAYGNLPDVLLPMWLKGVYETGKYMVGLYERSTI